MSAPAIGQWEQRLERSGLAALDYDDGAGGIRVGNKGSGKVLDERRAFTRVALEAKAEQRRAMVTRHVETHVYRRGDRDLRALKLYARGVSMRVIARRTGVGRMAVFRLVSRIERERPPEERIDELLDACEPTTIVLIFSLVERALCAPREVRAMIERARDIPEIRAIIEPDEVRDDG